MPLIKHIFIPMIYMLLHIRDYYLVTSGYVPGLSHVGVIKVLFITSAKVEVYTYTYNT